MKLYTGVLGTAIVFDKTAADGGTGVSYLADAPPETTLVTEKPGPSDILRTALNGKAEKQKEPCKTADFLHSEALASWSQLEEHAFSNNPPHLFFVFLADGTPSAALLIAPGPKIENHTDSAFAWTAIDKELSNTSSTLLEGGENDHDGAYSLKAAKYRMDEPSVSIVDDVPHNDGICKFHEPLAVVKARKSLGATKVAMLKSDDDESFDTIAAVDDLLNAGIAMLEDIGDEATREDC
ncbi:MAG: hypothetical protein M1822_005358 [Bathelium mastoideum]|nr:MAG: hypothetical protein M1822_005358 [Bathelium mastoideum]